MGGDWLYGAEVALHKGDTGPRLAIWSTNEPVTVLGSWRSATNRAETSELFESLAMTFSGFVSYSFELVAGDVVGDMAYTVGYEHTEASIDGQPRT